MKNLKLGPKLVLSYSIIALIAAIVGIVGIVSLKNMDTAYSSEYGNIAPLPYIAKAMEEVQRMNVGLREIVIYCGDQAQLARVERNINDARAEFTSCTDSYNAAVTDSSYRDLFDGAKDIYTNKYAPAIENALAKAKGGAEPQALLGILGDTSSMADDMIGKLSQCIEQEVAAGLENSRKNTDTVNLTVILLIVFVAVCVALAIVLGVIISRSIIGPVLFIKYILTCIGKEGDMVLSPKTRAAFDEYAKRRDEMGETIGMQLTAQLRLLKVSQALESVADGDLTTELELLSKDDTMGKSLLAMMDNLNSMFGEINNSSAQVSTVSRQLADGAQSLARGTAEQVSSIEELSTSIVDISDRTNINANVAREAAELSGVIRDKAESGSSQMDHLMRAVREINDASNQISKVIKVIDDIAFQTNILSLNAAVEAARAGQHGKGFAVVAEEVRGLAAKSAEAAKDTGGLIENSIEKANLGLNIATETADSLKDIVEGIIHSAEIVTQIAQSSDEQAEAIKQINAGIEQVSHVVHQNSATAEESASAADEMSGQADMLEHMTGQFKLKS